jgi:hypothetical protein
MKKLNQSKRPSGAGTGAPASHPTKSATDLLTILKRNAARATEPELVQRLHDAIRAMETRRG